MLDHFDNPNIVSEEQYLISYPSVLMVFWEAVDIIRLDYLLDYSH